MPTIQLGDAISNSFKFIGVAWRHAWGVLLLLVWLTAAQQVISVLRPDWTAAPLVGLVLIVATSVAVSGALYRLGVESDHAGDPQFRAHVAGFQWGGLEWRVLGANLLVGLIFGAVAVVLAIIWVVIFGMSIAGDQSALNALNGADESAKTAAMVKLFLGPVGMISLLLGLVALAAFVYFAARLSLYALLAADAGSFSIGRAWALSRGAVIAIIVTSLVIGLVQGVGGGVLAGIGAAVASATGQGQSVVSMWAGIGWQVASAAIATPLSAGLQIYVYRTKRVGDRADASIAATFS